MSAVPGAVPTPGQVAADKLTITPERVLAPVGSEVVLKSGICVAEGYLLADQKIEWMLGRNGVGQFVELGGKGWFHPAVMPWNKPKKIDNYYAVGYSANKPLCITRGTPDPADDMEILRGEAWVSVTSPVEGISYITSHTPKVASWPERRADAAIYWVDVQWSFPPGTINGSGRPEQLTTMVTRQTDGMPLEGWLVRYEVNDGGGLAGAGQVQEVRTGPDGRAAVEISPTGSGASSSRVDVQLIRPARYGNSEMPQLIVGSGTTMIHWGVSDIPYLPQDSGAAGGVSQAPENWQSPSAGPSLPEQPVRRPELEVFFRRSGPESPQVDEFVYYDVEIRNNGNAAATAVTLDIVCTGGLDIPFEWDEENRNQIQNTAPGTIQPASSWTSSGAVPFQVLQPGEHCVTIRASTADPTAPSQVEKQDCFTAVSAPVQQLGRLTISKDGPVQAAVGETVDFAITVENSGEGPLTDVQVTDEYPVGTLRALQIPNDAQHSDGIVTWMIPQLNPQQRVTFYVQCECLQQHPRYVAMATASARAGGELVTTSDDHVLIIAAAPPGSTPAAGPLGADVSPTGIVIESRSGYGGTERAVNASTTDLIVVRVINRNPRTGLDDTNVNVTIELPNATSGSPLPITADMSRAEYPTGGVPRLEGNIVRFATVMGLLGEDQLEFRLPVTYNQAGIFPIVARVRSRNITDSGRESETAVVEIEVLNR